MRQTVHRMNPRQLSLGPRVILGRDELRPVQATRCYIDFIWEIEVVIGKRRTTVGTEAAQHLCTRCENLWRSFNEQELCGIDAEPGDEGRRRGTSTIGAVANRGVERYARRFISYLCAKAAAGKHHRSLRVADRITTAARKRADIVEARATWLALAELAPSEPTAYALPGLRPPGPSEPTLTAKARVTLAMRS